MNRIYVDINTLTDSVEFTDSDNNELDFNLVTEQVNSCLVDLSDDVFNIQDLKILDLTKFLEILEQENSCFSTSEYALVKHNGKEYKIDLNLPFYAQIASVQIYDHEDQLALEMMVDTDGSSDCVFANDKYNFTICDRAFDYIKKCAQDLTTPLEFSFPVKEVLDMNCIDYVELD